MSDKSGPKIGEDDFEDPPPVPDPASGTVPFSTLPPNARANDAVERGVSEQGIAVGNSLLKLQTQEFNARQWVLFFGLGLTCALFISGIVLFLLVCYKTRIFSWDKILLLFVCFTPATIIFGVLIKAVYASQSDKKDDSSSSVPHTEMIKALTDLLKLDAKP